MHSLIAPARVIVLATSILYSSYDNYYAEDKQNESEGTSYRETEMI